MTTEALNKELAQESARLSEAKKQADEAAKKLAKDPASPQLRLGVMKAQQAISEVQIGIDALKAAQSESEKIAANESQEAQRAETLAVFKQAMALQTQRPVAARAIDTALTALHDALAAWKDLNGQARQAALDFYRRAYEGPSPHIHALPLQGMGSEVLNTLAARISAAAGDIPESYRFITYNHISHPGRNESAEEDASQSADRCVQFLQSVAQTHGVI